MIRVYAGIAAGVLALAGATWTGYTVGASSRANEVAGLHDALAVASRSAAAALTKAQAEHAAAMAVADTRAAEAQATYADVLRQNAVEINAARAALRDARKAHAPLLDTRLPDDLVRGLRGEAGTP